MISREALADASLKQGRFDDALALFQRVVADQPANLTARTRYGTLLIDAGRIDDGVRELNRVLSAAPGHAQARMNRGVGLLYRGNFRDGWSDYRWRWRCPEFAGHPLSQLPVAPWDGSSLEGRTILLHHEQGIGDTIQFARYAPMVRARGGQVVLGAPLAMKRVLSTLDGVDQIATAEDPPAAFHTYAALMDLPNIFGTTLETIPASVPYLSAESALVSAWADRLGPPEAMRVGLAWAGNPQHVRDSRRSTSLVQLQPLLRVSDVEFFSLQKGPASIEAAALGLRDLGPYLEDLADTAAALMQMDLVITVDTSVAHLAGALGRPVWLLLSHAHDWRWLLDRTDSPWYPTFQLFRQRRPGDWQGLAERVAGALRQARR